MTTPDDGLKTYSSWGGFVDGPALTPEDDAWLASQAGQDWQADHRRWLASQEARPGAAPSTPSAPALTTAQQRFLDGANDGSVPNIDALARAGAVALERLVHAEALKRFLGK